MTHESPLCKCFSYVLLSAFEHDMFVNSTIYMKMCSSPPFPVHKSHGAFVNCNYGLNDLTALPRLQTE
jgi:hypothetical protein